MGQLASRPTRLAESARPWLDVSLRSFERLSEWLVITRFPHKLALSAADFQELCAFGEEACSDVNAQHASVYAAFDVHGSGKVDSIQLLLTLVSVSLRVSYESKLRFGFFLQTVLFRREALNATEVSLILNTAANGLGRIMSGFVEVPVEQIEQECDLVFNASTENRVRDFMRGLERIKGWEVVLANFNVQAVYPERGLRARATAGERLALGAGRHVECTTTVATGDVFLEDTAERERRLQQEQDEARVRNQASEQQQQQEEEKETRRKVEEAARERVERAREAAAEMEEEKETRRKVEEAARERVERAREAAVLEESDARRKNGNTHFMKADYYAALFEYKSALCLHNSGVKPLAAGTGVAAVTAAKSFSIQFLQNTVPLLLNLAACTANLCQYKCTCVYSEGVLSALGTLQRKPERSYLDQDRTSAEGSGAKREKWRQWRQRAELKARYRLAAAYAGLGQYGRAERQLLLLLAVESNPTAVKKLKELQQYRKGRSGLQDGEIEAAGDGPDGVSSLHFNLALALAQEPDPPVPAKGLHSDPLPPPSPAAKALASPPPSPASQAQPRTPTALYQTPTRDRLTILPLSCSPVAPGLKIAVPPSPSAWRLVHLGDSPAQEERLRTIKCEKAVLRVVRLQPAVKLGSISEPVKAIVEMQSEKAMLRAVRSQPAVKLGSISEPVKAIVEMQSEKAMLRAVRSQPAVKLGSVSKPMDDCIHSQHGIPAELQDKQATCHANGSATDATVAVETAQTCASRASDEPNFACEQEEEEREEEHPAFELPILPLLSSSSASDGQASSALGSTSSSAYANYALGSTSSGYDDDGEDAEGDDDGEDGNESEYEYAGGSEYEDEYDDEEEDDEEEDDEGGEGGGGEEEGEGSEDGAMRWGAGNGDDKELCLMLNGVEGNAASGEATADADAPAGATTAATSADTAATAVDRGPKMHPPSGFGGRGLVHSEQPPHEALTLAAKVFKRLDNATGSTGLLQPPQILELALEVLPVCLQFAVGQSVLPVAPVAATSSGSSAVTAQDPAASSAKLGSHDSHLVTPSPQVMERYEARLRQLVLGSDAECPTDGDGEVPADANSKDGAPGAISARRRGKGPERAVAAPSKGAPLKAVLGCLVYWHFCLRQEQMQAQGAAQQP
jgi:hypothetical protein